MRNVASDFVRCVIRPLHPCTSHMTVSLATNKECLPSVGSPQPRQNTRTPSTFCGCLSSSPVLVFRGLFLSTFFPSLILSFLYSTQLSCTAISTPPPLSSSSASLSASHPLLPSVYYLCSYKWCRCLVPDPSNEPLPL